MDTLQIKKVALAYHTIPDRDQLPPRLLLDTVTLPHTHQTDWAHTHTDIILIVLRQTTLEKRNWKLLEPLIQSKFIIFLIWMFVILFISMEATKPMFCSPLLAENGGEKKNKKKIATTIIYD